MKVVPCPEASEMLSVVLEEVGYFPIEVIIFTCSTDVVGVSVVFAQALYRKWLVGLIEKSYLLRTKMVVYEHYVWVVMMRNVESKPLAGLGYLVFTVAAF